jgi:hypothetical protein
MSEDVAITVYGQAARRRVGMAGGRGAGDLMHLLLEKVSAAVGCSKCSATQITAAHCNIGGTRMPRFEWNARRSGAALLRKK